MTILVAVANDETRTGVLDTAVETAKAFDEDLSVVHLTESETATAGDREIRDELRATLADSEVAFSVGIEHVEHATPRPGRAIGRQIADIASDVTVTRVVVGHHSKDLLERVVTGDTAFTLVEAADVPVTVVPDPAQSDE